MPDTKLSALSTGTTPTYFYGEEGGASKKYAGLQVYNVKDYGADPSGSADSASAIQAAVDAAKAAAGGVVYFPTGLYKVLSHILFDPDDHASLRIVGCGGLNQFEGTRITTPSQDYIFYCHSIDGSGNQPIASIEHIFFINSYNPGAHGTITSTEISGGGFGCLYLTAGINLQINCCGFTCVNGGIGLFNNGISTAVNSCSFFGSFGTTHAEDSYGIIANNLSIRDLHLVGWGVGITLSAPGLVGWMMLDGGDLEVNGCAIRLGYIPIDQWDPFALPFPGGAVTTGASIATAIIRNVDLESNGDSDGSSNAAGNSVAAVIDIYQTQACILENVKSQNIARSQACGISIRNATGTKFDNVSFAGGSSFGYTSAALNFVFGGDVASYSCLFEAGSFVGHGADVTLPTLWNGGTKRGLSFDGCVKTGPSALVGAIALANLPAFANYGARMTISDSTVAASGHFGATIVGGGGNQVVGQSDGAGNWIIVG